MTPIKAIDFMIALADYVASVSPALKRSAPGIELFANVANDTVAADCFSTLRHYDGDAATVDGRRHLAVQCETLAKPSSTQSAAVLAQRASEMIYARLRGDVGPIKRKTLGGFTLLSLKNLRPPRLVGGEENGRQRASFNFDVYYLPNGG